MLKNVEQIGSHNEFWKEYFECISIEMAIKSKSSTLVRWSDGKRGGNCRCKVMKSFSFCRIVIMFFLQK